MQKFDTIFEAAKAIVASCAKEGADCPRGMVVIDAKVTKHPSAKVSGNLLLLTNCTNTSLRGKQFVKVGETQTVSRQARPFNISWYLRPLFCSRDLAFFATAASVLSIQLLVVIPGKIGHFKNLATSPASLVCGEGFAQNLILTSARKWLAATARLIVTVTKEIWLSRIALHRKPLISGAGPVALTRQLAIFVSL